MSIVKEFIVPKHRVYFYSFFLLSISLLFGNQRVSVQIGILWFLFFLLCLQVLHQYTFQTEINLSKYECILLFSLLYLVRFIFCFAPAFWEDDWARYLWEGNLILKNDSPYLRSPEFFFQNQTFPISPEEESILSQINHPDWTSIYSPGINLYFALLSFLSPLSFIVFKASYLFFDLIICFLIWKVRGIWFALSFAALPILTKEVYLNGHFELIGLTFFAMSLYWIREKPRAISFFCLGIATHCKLWFGIALPFYLCFHSEHKDPKENIWKILKLSIYFLLGYLSFFFLAELFQLKGSALSIRNLILFTREFQFNSIAVTLVKFCNLPNENLILLLLVVFAILAELYFYRKSSWEHLLQTLTRSFLLFFVLSPVVNAWYCLAFLPLFYFQKEIPRANQWILFVWQCAYLTYQNLPYAQTGISHGFYEVPTAVILIEYTIILGIFFHFNDNKSILIDKTSNILNKSKYERNQGDR
ncbi:hypothetical protein [Leptospira ryugenii]|uniref:hypothetical protein n=1 Tax=Leptospira ryugenii TaxID=1917863 RepID=UPI000D59FA1E|nr:hypothetical protein [Leptospira ryugenii]